jgi:hypothetical protein
MGHYESICMPNCGLAAFSGKEEGGRRREGRSKSKGTSLIS